MENVYIINENEDLIKIKQNWGIVKPIVVLYSGMYRTFDSVFETHHLQILKQITNNDLDSCIVGMHTWYKNGNGGDNPDKPNDSILKNIKNIKYTKTDDPCNYIKTDPINYTNTMTNNYKNIFMERWSYSMNEALKNAKEIYLQIYGIEMPENQPILRLRYDTYFMQIQQYPFSYPLLKSILPCIFIQNIIILYETINETKYTHVYYPIPIQEGGGRIEIKNHRMDILSLNNLFRCQQLYQKHCLNFYEPI